MPGPVVDPNATVVDPNAAPEGAASPTPPAAQGAEPAAADSGEGGSGGEEGSSSAAAGSPPAASGEGEAGAAPIAAVTKKEDWREAKIRRLTAQLHSLRDSTGEGTSGEAPAADPAAAPEARLQEAEIERRAQERAREISSIETFNRMCKETATAGRQAFPDFDTRITALREAFAGGQEDMRQQIVYNQFVAAALETGQAPQLLHQLGGDLDEAARIMSLPPIKMAVELTKLAGRAPDTSTTRAPKPIVPVGSKGSAHTQIAPDDPDRADNLPTAEWMKRRNEQDKQRREASGRR